MNREVANKLREIANLLEAQQANHFRINAFRRAANTIENLHVPIQDIVRNHGIAGLTALHGIGEGIASSIYEFVATGNMSRLNHLKGEHDPVSLFRQIPGIGKQIAQQLHEELNINSLEELEITVHDERRLKKIEHLGDKRIKAIKMWLDSVLGQKKEHPFVRANRKEPPVSLILDIDQIYLRLVSKNALPKIAPRRFNPEKKAWLPVLHTSRNGLHFTAMFSNTYRAHELNRTHDWVIIHYYDNHHRGGQYTVVNEIHGKMSGRRVVRGRERECYEYYFHDIAV